MDIEDLEPLIGRWEIPIDGGEPGEAVFSWALGGAFVEQRSSLPVEGAPDGLMVIAPAAGGDGFTQHYFDSRGVVRLYAMRSTAASGPRAARAGLLRAAFHQRFEGTLSDDGSRIDGRWLIAHDGEHFELDFPLTYVRA